MLLSLANIEDDDLELMADDQLFESPLIAALAFGEDQSRAAAATMVMDEPRISAATAALLPPRLGRTGAGVAWRETPSYLHPRRSTAPPRAARGGSYFGRIWLFGWLAFALFYWSGSTWFFPGVEPVREQVHEQIAIENIEIHNRLAGYNLARRCRSRRARASAGNAPASAAGTHQRGRISAEDDLQSFVGLD